MKTLDDVLIVTASDTTHFYSQMQMLESVRACNPTSTTVVVNLGWKEEECNEIFLRTDVFPFPYAWFPEWIDINNENGCYGWKPQIVRFAARKYNPRVLIWSDAENTFHDIAALADLIKREGMAAGATCGTLRMWTDRRTIDAIGVPDHRLDMHNRNAACVGFDLQNPEAVRILNAWADLALRKEVIAPEGTNRKARPPADGKPGGHRQDLSVLNCLLACSPLQDKMTYKRVGWKGHQAIDREVRKGKQKLPTSASQTKTGTNRS